MTPRLRPRLQLAARCAAALGIAIVALSSITQAQSLARRPVSPGAVQGVELGLEGPLTASRGGKLRWLLVAHKVVGLSDLRPAPNARIDLFASFQPQDPVATATADAFGRANVELAIPTDAPDSFGVVLDVIVDHTIHRRFQLTVTTTEPYALELYVQRAHVPVSGTVRLFGRLAEQSTGQARAGARVLVSLLDAAARPIVTPLYVTTTAAGVFGVSAPLPPRVSGPVTVHAAWRIDEHHTVEAEPRTVVVDRQLDPELVATLSLTNSIVAPSARVRATLYVRRADATPVVRAVVTVPPDSPGSPSRELRTDARGVVQFEWVAPPDNGGFADVLITAHVAAEGFAPIDATAAARVTGRAYFADLVTEGDALVAELGGRVFARVVSADGHRAGAGVSVSLSGPRITGAPLTRLTDEDGIATFDVTLGSAGASDTCGGETATAAHLDIAAPASSNTQPGRTDTCLWVDPDGAARVRVSSPRVIAGRALHIEVERTRAAAHLPVVVSLASAVDATLAPFTAHVMPPNASAWDATLPPDVVGRVVVRARPLFGANLEEVRGAVTSVLCLPAEPLTAHAAFDARAQTLSWTSSTTPERDSTLFGFAAPLADARLLYDTLSTALSARLPTDHLGRDDGSAPSDPFVRFWLASLDRRDDGAPAALRAGHIVPMAAPEDPTALGLQRDPWRSRARFVGGRLNLLFSAVEQRVAQVSPEDLVDVASRQSGHWIFNEQILDAAAATGMLGAEGATSLGGEPVTMAELRALDPAFTYDNVARRVTRRRLIRVLVALRARVREDGFDLRWTWHGDPAQWLEDLTSQEAELDSPLEANDLVDAWGTPLALVPARGGHPRFGAIAPVQGYELVSAGPDGRIGTADDMFDPTARVLPTTSVYAQAVREDALVARLRGVELGRALLEDVSLQGFDGVSSVSLEEESESPRAPRETMALPSALLTPNAEGALERTFRPGDGAGARPTAMNRTTDLVFAFDDEPRRWGAVAVGWTPHGTPTLAFAQTVGGAPALLDVAIPARTRSSHATVLDVHVTNVSSVALHLELRAHADGASLVAAATGVDLEPLESKTIAVTFTAAHALDANAAVELFDHQGRLVAHVEHAVHVDDGLHPLRAVATGALASPEPGHDGAWETTLSVPRDAFGAHGRVVVLDGRTLDLDPDLAEVLSRDPALAGWYTTLIGRGASPDVAAAMLRAQTSEGSVEGDSPSLSTACALVAWSAADASDDRAASAAERARNVSRSMMTAMTDSDPRAGLVRTWAAVLVALATAGPAPNASTSSDPVATLTTSLARALRRALREIRGEPALLARAAAALLSLDPRDEHGLVMLDLAKAALEPRANGQRVRTSLTRPTADDALTATLALALAAHEAGDDSLRASLVRGAFADAYLLEQASSEPTFWLFSLGAYGALEPAVTNAGDESPVIVSVDGRAHPLDLAHGESTVELGPLASSERTSIEVHAPSGRTFLARAEAVYGRTFSPRSDAPFTLSLDGDPGHYRGISALELTVTATRDVAAPIVAVELAPGTSADDSVLEMLRVLPGVLSATAREPGFIRLELSAMRSAEARTIPISLRWRARGALHGLGIIAFERGTPDRMTALAPRAWQIR